MKSFYSFYLLLLLILVVAQLEINPVEDTERDDTIYLVSNVNEIFATTEVTQYFSNPLDNPIELIISFPIKEEISLSKFVVSIGEKVVTSKVMPKEKAEEKYEETIKEGNTGFLSQYDADGKNYRINLGNISPKQKVKLISTFIQAIGSQDISYEFVIMEKYPTFHYKELNEKNDRNKKIEANFKIQTQSKITRLITPFYDEQAKNNSKYEVSFSNDYKCADIKYTKNPDDQKNYDVKIEDPNHSYPGQVNKPTFLTSFSILFRTQDMNNPVLYYQYNPEFKETSYSINYVYSSQLLKSIPISPIPDQDPKISYYSKYRQNAIYDTPGLFVFLIDQSGSMSGEPIELVKKSLLLFIKSLPSGSYFQFIGFGTDFKKYNEEPVEYNKKNVEDIINIINKMNANFGGTNISGPLKAIYNDNKYSNINLSKTLFLLTDGQVNNRDECIELITANANKFRIHAIGLGNDFDRVLIERSGKLGKGSSSFAVNIGEINLAVIDALNMSLRPYISNLEFNFKNYENNDNIVLINPTNQFTYQDEVINYAFILDKKNRIDIDGISHPITIEILGNNQENIIRKEVSFEKNKNIIKLDDGDELTKMIIGRALKYNKDLTENETNEVKIAVKYQILSKNTALFAEILNDKNDSSRNELIKVNINEYKSVDNNILPIYNSGSAIYNGIDASYDDSFEDMDYEEDSSEEEKNNNDSKETNDLSKLILSQDIIEGFWDENEETKKLVTVLTIDKFNEINNEVRKLNKGDDENKILYTTLVIYYLNTKESDKLNEYRLIINKAKKYLASQGVSFEDIIQRV